MKNYGLYNKIKSEICDQKKRMKSYKIATSKEKIEIEEYMIASNIHFVMKIVNTIGYSPYSSITKEDLFQAGMIGFIKAIRTIDFDTHKNMHSYFWRSIERHCFNEILAYDVIKTPSEIKNLLSKLRIYKRENKDASHSDCIDFLNSISKRKITKSLVEDVIEYADHKFDGANILSFETRVRGNLKYDDIIQSVDSYNEIDEYIKKLNKREQDIIIMRYFYGQTRVVIGRKFGISPQRIAVIEDDAISKLRNELSKE